MLGIGIGSYWEIWEWKKLKLFGHRVGSTHLGLWVCKVRASHLSFRREKMEANHGVQQASLFGVGINLLPRRSS